MQYNDIIACIKKAEDCIQIIADTANWKESTFNVSHKKTLQKPTIRSKDKYMLKPKLKKFSFLKSSQ